MSKVLSKRSRGVKDAGKAKSVGFLDFENNLLMRIPPIVLSRLSKLMGMFSTHREPRRIRVENPLAWFGKHHLGSWRLFALVKRE